MKNKITTPNCLALLIVLYLTPFHGSGQESMSFSSVSFSALNDIYAAPAPIEQPAAYTSTATEGVAPALIKTVAPSEQTIGSSGVQTTGFAVTYDYYLCLNYSVPYFVYYDWRHLQSTASKVMANWMLSRAFDSNALYMLATTGFNSYSENNSKQKLEFRIGSRTAAQYGGDFPPVVPNYSMPIRTLTFSAY